MPMSKEYMIVRGDTIALLENAVNAYLALGWVLQGGVASHNIGNMTTFIQAMTREEEMPGAWG